MAERLAPEHAPLRISSRPERPRGRTGRWLRRLVGTVLAVAVLLAGSVFTLHFLAIQRSAKEIRATGLIPAELAANVLVVVARPGQEAAMAGTLAELDDAGAQVHLLSLTSGEAQPPPVEPGGERLAGIRADELAASADVLGVDDVTVAGFPDSQLLAEDPGTVTDAIAKAIAEVKPTAIITVADLTGADTDSQAVAAYTVAAAQAKGSGVARVWTVTRGDREVTWNELLDRPVATEHPAAQVAVRVEDHAMDKGRVLQLHGTMSPDLVESTYPFADRIPAWAYFAFWDREYFALAWGQPLG